MIINTIAALALAAFVEVEPPPAVYDFEPGHPYRVVYSDQRVLNKVCRGPLEAARRQSPGYEVQVTGCTMPLLHLIYILNTVDNPEDVLRHEKAHLNGWVH